MKIEILDVCDCRVSNALAKIIEPALSFTAVYYRQGPFRKVRKEYSKSVMSRGTDCYYFPTGLLDTVVDYCRKRNVDIEVTGSVERLKPTTKPSLNGITFREEQIRLIEKAIEKQRGVLLAPTGTGKTILGLAVASAFPKCSVLWLCHTQDLMYQAADEAKKLLPDSRKIGFIGDGKNEPTKLTFATRQSFVKCVGEHTCNYDIIVIDECFHRNTKIKTEKGSIPISEIKVNDFVYSSTGINRVSHVFKTKVSLSRVCKVTLTNGSILFTTIDHKFMTENGWLPIQDCKGKILVDDLHLKMYMMDNITSTKGEQLNEKTTENYNCMSPMQKTIFNTIRQTRKVLQSKMLLRKQSSGKIKSKFKRGKDLSYLQGYVYNLQNREKEILFGEMHTIQRCRKEMSYMWKLIQQTYEILLHCLSISKFRIEEVSFGTNETNESKASKNNFTTNENQQSIKHAGCCRKTNNYSSNKRNLVHKKTRWERNRSFTFRTRFINCVRKAMDQQFCCKNIPQTVRRISSSLQNRRCSPYSNARDRNRRIKSFTSERSRSKEGGVTNQIRVEDITIYREGCNDKHFIGIIDDKERNKKFVEFYDLEVENDHNYFAEGVLVHNCHHLSTGQYGTIMRNMLSPIRIGLTATMPTEKETLLNIEGLLGPVLEKVTIKEGQDRGTMADIKIKFLKVPTDYNLRELRKYADVYRTGVVTNRAQHRAIVDKTKEHIDKGDSVLILVTQIEHGENLLHEFQQRNIEACFASGSTEGSVRKEIKDALNAKDIHVAIATTIFKEGINLPELNVLINAAGGKSEIATIQAVGRGLRLTETKKELIFYDIMNLSHPFLVAHLAERLAVYSTMDWL